MTACSFSGRSVMISATSAGVNSAKISRNAAKLRASISSLISGPMRLPIMQGGRNGLAAGQGRAAGLRESRRKWPLAIRIPGE